MNHTLYILSSVACLSGSLVACGESAQTVEVAPSYIVNGATVYDNASVSAKTIAQNVEAFDNVMKAMYPQSAAIDYSKVILVIDAKESYSASECGDARGCWGYVKRRPDGTYKINVATPDNDCFANNALAHELMHVFLQVNFGDADHNHSKAIAWGYNSLLDAAKVDAAMYCKSGATNLNKT